MKKGFTLIELLAVIVILAIIALIATPIVLNIINESKESVGLRSAEMYLDAAEQAISIERMNNTNFKPNTCSITSEGNLFCEGYDPKIEVKVNGEKPIDGNITFTSGKITQVELKYENGKTIVMNNDGDLEYKKEETIKYTSLGNYQHQLPDGAVEDHEVTFDSNGHGICSKCGETVLAAGLYDENDVMLASWDELNNSNTLSVSSSTLECNDTSISGKLIIDDSVTSIGDRAFAYTGLTSVIIPNSVTSIDVCAFQECKRLTSVTLPDSLTKIPMQMFQGCTSLTSIKIPDNVTYIGGGAFRECRNLQSINIPNGVTSTGEAVFVNCRKLTSITLPDSLTKINSSMFENCQGLTSIIIPDSVTVVYYSAFQYCRNLTSIYIPSSVTSIDLSGSVGTTFYDCSPNLKIYCEASEAQSGWTGYSNGKLDIVYGVTRVEYEALIAE